MRRNGLDVSRMNSRKPTAIMPCTASTRARRAGGKLSLNSATAAEHSDSMNTHSSMEPSWFPHTPVILYSSGLSVWLFSATLMTEKSDVT